MSFLLFACDSVGLFFTCVSLEFLHFRTSDERRGGERGGGKDRLEKKKRINKKKRKRKRRKRGAECSYRNG